MVFEMDGLGNRNQNRKIPYFSLIEKFYSEDGKHVYMEERWPFHEIQLCKGLCIVDHAIPQSVRKIARKWGRLDASPTWLFRMFPKEKREQHEPLGRAIYVFCVLVSCIGLPKLGVSKFSPVFHAGPPHSPVQKFTKRPRWKTYIRTTRARLLLCAEKGREELRYWTRRWWERVCDCSRRSCFSMASSPSVTLILGCLVRRGVK